MPRPILKSSEYDAILPWQFGSLGLKMDGRSVSRVDFLGKRACKNPLHADAVMAVDSLQAYLEQANVELEFSVKFIGTPFQKTVWQALRTIRAGEVLTYGELARKLGSSPRAVGGACRENPVPVLVPCHRVISASGLGGFAGNRDGKMISIKRWLLHHEGLELS
ncbi:MAG: methylated-DNA--[protein]-cysteine S-methyltransferase [Gammaproteobacteria bacterium]